MKLNSHKDRRTASTPAMAAAAAKNIAKRSASYAHANPRLNKETSAITVSSRTLTSNPSPPLCREHTLALSRTNRGERGARCVPIKLPQGTGIDALVEVDLPIPKPGPRQVLVKVAACSLNYRDLAIALGTYRMPIKPNLIPLSDGGGGVVAVGGGGTR